MGHSTLFMLVIVAAQMPGLGPLQPQAPMVSHNIRVARDWVFAVRGHAPGERDAALHSVTAWSSNDALAAWVDAQALIAIVKNDKTNSFSLRPSDEQIGLRAIMSRADVEVMRELARQIRQDSLDRFLKRAAVLHSDVAQEFQINGTASAPKAMWSQRLTVQSVDGQQTGTNGGVAHWEFGRMLLDALPDVARDEFARTWYRSSLAFKLMVADLDSAHFARALEIFPKDAVIRFQKGCMHDTLSHPAVQSLTNSARLPFGVRLDVRSEGGELGEAERDFRRAIELDPALAEARLRRGRVLARRGKYDLALTELQQALPALREPVLEYYARLFRAAAEEALGRLTEAQASYEQAARLYPHAQAPRLGLSQLAHRSGNRAAARATLGAMFEQSPETGRDDDPWWNYHRSAGRMADEWRKVTYHALPHWSSPASQP